MGDGSLSQNEIDELLKGADDVTSAGNNSIPEDEKIVKKSITPETLSPHLNRLLNEIAEGMRPYLNDNVNIQPLPAVMVDEENSASLAEYGAVAAVFNHGHARIAILMTQDLADKIVQLMMGVEKDQIKGLGRELYDAEKSCILELFNAAGESLAKHFTDIPGGSRHFSFSVNYGEEARECVNSNTWDWLIECSFRVSDSTDETDLIDSSFHLVINKDAAELFFNLVETMPASVSFPEGINRFQLTNGKKVIPVYQYLKSKLRDYARDKGKGALKKKNIIEFYKTGLDPDEQRLIAGEHYADSGTRRGIKKIVSAVSEAVKTGGGSIYDPEYGLGNNYNEYRFPISLMSAEARNVHAYQGSDENKGGESVLKAGDKGTILLGKREIASGRIVKDWIGRKYFEVETTEMDNRINGGLSLSDAAHEFPFTISVVLAERNIPPEIAVSLKHGSILLFDKGAGEPVDIYLDEYGLLISKGEVCVCEEQFFLRITDIVNMNISAALDGSFMKRPPETPEPVVPVKMLLGRTKMYLKDLLGLGEGSIFELDRHILEPAELIVGESIKLKADTVVIDECFAARVLSVEQKPESDETENCVSSDESVYEAEIYSDSESKTGTEDETADDSELDGAIAETDELCRRGVRGTDGITHAELVGKIYSYINDDIEIPLYTLGKMLENNPQNAAIAMTAIGTENATPLMALLDEDQQKQLVFEIARIDLIPAEDSISVLLEFLDIADLRAVSIPGGVDYAREVLEGAVGTEKAIDIVNSLTTSLQVRPFDFIRRANPSHLSNFLQGEHPQVIALVLSYLDLQKSAFILSMLPHNLQANVTLRIAEMREVSPDVIREIERVLERKLSTLACEDITYSGGIDTVVEILNSVDRGTEKIIIEALEEEDPELAEEIKKRMFVFEEIVLLDDRAVQKFISQIDTQELAKALKGASAEVQEKIFKNMSKRAGTLLKEDMEFMGPVLQADVEYSQQKIINIIRKLEASGCIIVPQIGEEELIV